MSGTEIMRFLTNNFSDIATMSSSAIGAVVGSLITTVFLRSNTATQEFEKIKAGNFGDVINDLLTSGKMTYTEYYKSKNLLQIAKKADEVYVEMPHNDSCKEQNAAYDFDWFMRFYEAVGNVSDEEMQDIWSKILVGEVNSPSTYSLKTIDTLKNLSRKDAQLFSKLCSHSFYSSNNVFFPNYKEYMDQCGISYDDIMQLSELGLVYHDTKLECKVQVSEDGAICLANNLIMILHSKNKDMRIYRFQEYPFTLAGRQIAFCQKQFASDRDMISFGKILNNDPRIQIGVYSIESITNENKVSVEGPNLLEEI